MLGFTNRLSNYIYLLWMLQIHPIIKRDNFFEREIFTQIGFRTYRPCNFLEGEYLIIKSYIIYLMFIENQRKSSSLKQKNNKKSNSFSGSSAEPTQSVAHNQFTSAQDPINQNSWRSSLSDQQAVFSQTIAQLNQHLKNAPNSSMPYTTIQKFSSCFQSIFSCHLQSYECFLLNLSICLNFWKIACEMNVSDLKMVNEHFSAHFRREHKIVDPLSILTITVPVLKKQYEKTFEELKNSRISENLKDETIKRIIQRFLLFSIVCLKEFYQKNQLDRAYELGNDLVFNVLNYFENQKQNNKQYKKDETNQQLKFKVVYLMQKICHRMKKNDDELRWVQICLEAAQSKENRMPENAKQNKKYVKSEMIGKFKERRNELIRQKKSRQPNFYKSQNKLKISSLHNSQTKFQNSKSKMNLLTNKQRQDWCKTESMQNGFKKRSFSSIKLQKNMDFEKTHKQGYTLSNFTAFKASNKSFKKTDSTFNQTRPVQKYQIKINKLQKKPITQDFKKNGFVEALSELKTAHIDQDPNNIVSKTASMPYFNLLLLRPNEQNKPPLIENKQEKSLRQPDSEELNETRELKGSKLQTNYCPYEIKNNIGPASQYSYMQVSGKKQQKIEEAINIVQKQFLMKFLSNYQKNIKKQGKQLDSDISSSSIDELDDREQFKITHSVSKIGQNICGPREPRTRKQKIFHTIDQVLIPNVIIPEIGFVAKIRAGVSKIQVKKNTENVFMNENDSYFFHVKAFSEKYGAMYGQRKLTQINVDDGLSLQEQLMNMAQISALCFNQKAEMSTNICGYALQYLLLSFFKRFFGVERKFLGNSLKSVEKIIAASDRKNMIWKVEPYIRIKIYQDEFNTYEKILEHEGNEAVSGKLLSKTNQQIRRRQKKEKYKKLNKKYSQPAMKTPQIFQLSIKANDESVTFDEKRKYYERNSDICLLGQELYLPALIYEICTEASFTFKEVEPEIHADLISCFFMTRQPLFMRESFFRSMKFILTTSPKRNDVTNLYYDDEDFSFIFRLKNKRQYIVHLSFLKAKSLYYSPDLFFIKYEFQEKLHRIRKNKLLLTSKDIEKWSNQSTDNLHRLSINQSKQILYQITRSMVNRIHLKKSINAVKLGLVPQSEQHQLFYYSNDFKSSKITKSSGQSFLSPCLTDVRVVYQKMIKIKCFKSFGIVSVINVINSRYYDFYVYVPSSQNNIGFSLPEHFISQHGGNIDWSSIIKGIQFQVKNLRENRYFVVKVLGHQTFVQNNLYHEYFKVGNNIKRILVNIQEKRAPLNFRTPQKSQKYKIHRLSEKSENQGSWKPFDRIYSSQAAKFIIYLSIANAHTGQTLHFSYYLKELLGLAMLGKSSSSSNSDRHSSQLFNEQIIQFSNLLTIFNILSSSFIRQLTDNSDKYLIQGDTKKDRNQNRDIYSNMELQGTLKQAAQKLVMSEALLVRNQKNSKIKLNAPISINKRTNESIFYLYRHLQTQKHNSPVLCILYNSLSKKFIICIDKYWKGNVTIMEIDLRSHPMTNIEVISKNRGVLLGSRNRLARFWENLILVN